jgi:hypothetical protein
MYGDTEVNDPYLITVTLKNVGPVDITRTHFNRNVTVHLNCPIWLGRDHARV